MYGFTLYGLDEADRILSTEKLQAESAEAARQIARDRLSRFPRVELWGGSICVARLQRPGG